MLSSIAIVGSLALGALAQTPLIQQRFPWPYAGPYKVDTSDGPRGIMTGFNQCNSTNSAQNSSACVNAVVNSINDFCVYAPPEPNSLIANTEGECVAFCNTAKYNTRVIPNGAVTGALFVRTPGYLAMNLMINGPLLNVQLNDSGGELDPHGADNRGNPIGSLVYSNSFQTSQTGETQIYEWHEFISGQQICMKVCDPNNGDLQGNNNLCDNVHDTVGCNVNIPLPAPGTVFQQCSGANQLPPASNLGASIYTPPISQCTTFTSSVIFAAGATLTQSSSSSSASMSSSASSMSSGASSATSGSTSTSASATATRSSGAAVPMLTAAPVLAFAGLAAAAFI